MTTPVRSSKPPSTPLLSVALCTYNGARYIAQQIRSICEQTLLPDEIVLSDDASRDDCVAIARQAHEAWASDPHAVPRLRVLHNEKSLGITRNFEQAIEACEGEFIALCDQDDIWHPEKARRLMDAMHAGRLPSLVHTDARLVDSQGHPLGVTLFESLSVTRDELAGIHGGKGFDVLLRRNLVTGATAAFRRSLLDHALPFPPEWLHDEWLGVLAAATGGVEVLEWSSIDYRQHGANQVGARRLGLKSKIDKALAPRGDDAARRSARAQALVARLEVLGDKIAPGALESARKKLAHQRHRAALPRLRLARAFPIALELASGRYARYDYGIEGAIRDLLAAP
ncbi:glycosyltransferase family 2 protein [Variovorax sp. OV329]|uniref:glycosyltransferase family 2 protein n=1 Tax=Variovorax sp. OV329 TaxID=1882825 RepID=UPI0008F40D81|nr:glycosyltransferase family 2 protein [Variovorax sp. OV329]SFN06906.1 Glycosyl transferase family 2 [Variovorax sp. OV329]